MKIKTMRFGDVVTKVNLIEKDELKRISTLGESDIDAALAVVSNFIKAGDVLVDRYKDSVTIVPIASLHDSSGERPDFTAHFTRRVFTFRETGVIELFGVGKTEVQAKNSLLAWFVGDVIPAKLFNKNGPVYVCEGLNAAEAVCFQFERKMVQSSVKEVNRAKYH